MKQPMTLVERLRNPAYVTNPTGGDALLNTKRTIRDMREAADAIAAWGSRPAPRDRTNGKYAKARALRAQGLTIREIATKLGYRTTSSVHAALKQQR